MLNSTNTVPCSGRDATYNSGFNGPYCNVGQTKSKIDGVDFPDPKYYDLYDYAEENRRYNRRILGDATGEMGPFSSVTYSAITGKRQIGSWYADEAIFLHSWGPWFGRGEFYYRGNGSGTFFFGRDSGYFESEYSFRLVLVCK